MMDTKLLHIVKRAMGGDGDAFVRLCEAKAQDILYICIHLMGNREDGEDAAQEVLLKMQKGITRLRRAESFPAWLNRIVRYTCLDMRGMALDTDDTEATLDNLFESCPEFLPEACAELHDSRRQVIEAMKDLPTQYRQVLLMYYFESLSYRDMAVALECEERAIKNLMYRARLSLKKKLEGTGAGRAPVQAAMGAVPVLTRVLLEDAGLTVTQDMAASLVAPFGAAAKGAGAAAASTKLAMDIPTLLTTALVVAVSGTMAISGIAVQASPQVPIASGPAMQAAVPQQQAPEAPLPEDSLSLAFSMPEQSTASLPQGSEASSSLPAARGAAPTPRREEAPRTHTLTGAIRFVDGSGNTIAPALWYPERFFVEVLQEGTQLATATLDAAGGYSITLTALPSGSYVLRAGSVYAGEYACVQQHGGSVVFTMAEATLEDIVFVDNVAPVGSIRLLAEDDVELCGTHVNPAAAKIMASDITATTLFWELADSTTGETLRSGEEDTISFLGLEADSNGHWYLLRCTITDTAGNTAQVERQFVLLEE